MTTTKTITTNAKHSGKGLIIQFLLLDLLGEHARWTKLMSEEGRNL